MSNSFEFSAYVKIKWHTMAQLDLDSDKRCSFYVVSTNEHHADQLYNLWIGYHFTRLRDSVRAARR